MQVIKPSTIRRYYQKHTDAEEWLKAWLVTLKLPRWQSLSEVRKTYKKADSAKVESGSIVTIFDVKGNRYRLIVAIHYNAQCVYVRDFLTHAEYSNELWKKRH